MTSDKEMEVKVAALSSDEEKEVKGSALPSDKEKVFIVIRRGKGGRGGCIVMCRALTGRQISLTDLSVPVLAC